MQRSVGVRPFLPLRLLAGLAILLAAATVAGGCDTADRSIPTPSSTNPAASRAPASTQPASQAAVLAAYRAYWNDVIAAGKTADWRSPRLADHATGQALQTVRDHYRQLRAEGLVDRGTVTLHPRVTALQDDIATIQDCTDTSKFLKYDAKTGALRDTAIPELDSIVITLKRIKGAWIVTQTAGRGKCPS
jgi:hypothetical protein